MPVPQENFRNSTIFCFNWCVYSRGYREHSRLVGQAVGWLVEWLLYANEPRDEEAVYFER